MAEHCSVRLESLSFSERWLLLRFLKIVRPRGWSSPTVSWSSRAEGCDSCDRIDGCDVSDRVDCTSAESISSWTLPCSCSVAGSMSLSLAIPPAPASGRVRAGSAAGYSLRPWLGSSGDELVPCTPHFPYAPRMAPSAPGRPSSTPGTSATFPGAHRAITICFFDEKMARKVRGLCATRESRSRRPPTSAVCGRKRQREAASRCAGGECWAEGPGRARRASPSRASSSCWLRSRRSTSGTLRRRRARTGLPRPGSRRQRRARACHRWGDGNMRARIRARCRAATPLCAAYCLRTRVGNRPVCTAWSGFAAGAQALKGEEMRRQPAAVTGTHLQACVRRCSLHHTKASHGAQDSRSLRASARGTHTQTQGGRTGGQGGAVGPGKPQVGVARRRRPGSCAQKSLLATVCGIIPGPWVKSCEELQT